MGIRIVQHDSKTCINIYKRAAEMCFPLKQVCFDTTMLLAKKNYIILCRKVLFCWGKRSYLNKLIGDR